MVKHRRFKILSTEPNCNFHNSQLSITNVRENIKYIAEKLTEDPITEIPFEGVSQETLETAAEMFTYLNFCPTKIFSFYKDLFTNATAKDITLALTSIMKASVSDAHRISSTRIFEKCSDSFKLNLYKDVDILTLFGFPEKCKSSTEDCDESFKVFGN